MLPIYMVLIDDEDIPSFELLFNTLKSKMYHIAYGILCNESLAEECVSETFLSIAQNFHKIKDLTADDQRKYVVVSVRNRAFNILEKEKNHLSNLPYEDELYFNDKEQYGFDKETWKAALKKLSETDRDILYLVCILGMDYKQISKSFGISYTAVRQRFWIAKNNLRKIILEEGVQ